MKLSNLNKTLLVSTFAAVISGGVPVFADGSNTYINGSIGIQDFDTDRQLKTEQLISIGLERRYSNGWGAEIFLMDSSPSGKNNTGDIDVTQFGIDGLYYFKSDESNRYDVIQPYGALGLGLANFKSNVHTDKETQLRAGLGLRVILSEHWSAKADARLMYSEEASALDSTLTVGLSYGFNHQNKKVVPADGDNDGVIDANDNCPTTPAVAKVDSTGCALDTDGDGVPNYSDNCPATPSGTAVGSKGCALDSDNDGVADYADSCPNSPAGSQVDTIGCGLDSDNDGVTDDKDLCPASPAGVAVDANGCVLDSDNDGVADYQDNCLATAAGRAVDAQGCKFVLTSSEELTLKINFASNSNDITQDNYAEIEKVANFLRKYGEVNTVIEGHTDSRGADAYNANLSKGRAEAVMIVLIERFGIEADRVSALGYGEARPIASNDTTAGRLENRRVVAVMKAEVSQ
jgi:OOP family OmpA-OmpF porin